MLFLALNIILFNFILISPKPCLKIRTTSKAIRHFHSKIPRSLVRNEPFVNRNDTPRPVTCECYKLTCKALPSTRPSMEASLSPEVRAINDDRVKTYRLGRRIERYRRSFPAKSILDDPVHPLRPYGRLTCAIVAPSSRRWNSECLPFRRTDFRLQYRLATPLIFGSTPRAEGTREANGSSVLPREECEKETRERARGRSEGRIFELKSFHRRNETYNGIELGWKGPQICFRRRNRRSD